MNVFIADKLPGWCSAKIESLGAKAIAKSGLKEPELADAVRQADANVLIVRSTKVTRAVIDAAPSLALIIRAGAGVDTIDTDRAAERGIYVANCPGTNSAAVAELAIGLMLAVDRRIVENATDLRAGKWAKKEYSKADGIKGRTLGVLGVGAIGRLVIERAKALGMRVVAWSRSLTPEGAADLGVEFAAGPMDVAKAADVVSLHVAAAKETKGLVNAAFLAAMKPRAMLINTARGDVIDQAALIEALRAGKVRAGLDVYSGEPGAADTEFNSPLRDVPNWIGTHHIGASTEQAQDETAAMAVDIVADFLRTGQVANCVNMQPPSTDLHGGCRFVVRHMDKVGVLAGVLARLRDEGINVEDMENRIFRGATAAVCYLTLSKRPTAAVLASLQSDANIIRAAVVEA
ncbi:MAG: 3-phosphoglycerate dehydrogenase family protein [Phycisphaerae bacterium]|nr:3-phosphoglycerate dehydrogenase family protein [Phycisphaerae bacterium]